MCTARRRSTVEIEILMFSVSVSVQLPAGVRRRRRRSEIHRPDSDAAGVDRLLRGVRVGGGRLMARQSFIWTALPNGFTADGPAAPIGCCCRPGSNPQTSRRRRFRRSFPIGKIGRRTLARGAVRHHLNGVDGAVDADDTTAEQPRRRPARACRTRRCGRHCSRHDRFVRPYAYQGSVDRRRAVLRHRGSWRSLVEGLYRDLARRAGDDLPRISEIADST